MHCNPGTRAHRRPRLVRGPRYRWRIARSRAASAAAGAANVKKPAQRRRSAAAVDRPGAPGIERVLWNGRRRGVWSRIWQGRRGAARTCASAPVDARTCAGRRSADSCFAADSCLAAGPRDAALTAGASRAAGGASRSSAALRRQRGIRRGGRGARTRPRPQPRIAGDPDHAGVELAHRRARTVAVAQAVCRTPQHQDQQRREPEHPTTSRARRRRATSTRPRRRCRGRYRTAAR